MLHRNRILLKSNHLCILCFEQIIKKIERDLINDLSFYGLLQYDKIDFRNTDAKKILYHHIIFGICKDIISYKKRYKMDVAIIYDPTNIFAKSTEICSLTDCNTLEKYIHNIISVIKRKIPGILIYPCTDLIDNDFFYSGEGIDLLHIIESDMHCNTSKNFSDILAFT